MTAARERTVRPADRAAVLAANRNLKMARSAHAYVRGNTRQFYEWLQAQAPDSLPSLLKIVTNTSASLRRVSETTIN